MTRHTPLVADKVEAFRRLHDSYFVLPTIWDGLSALAAEDAGFGAVATSSAALGQANGILSSERIPLDQLARVTAAIVQAVRIPVSVDFEDGYPDATGHIGDSIRRILDTGAVAVNIEDAWAGHAAPLARAEDHARRIAEARLAAGDNAFVNARTDLFLQHEGVEPDVSVTEAIRRAKLYVEAGADGIYITSRGLDDADIARLVREIPVPLTLVAPADGHVESWPGLGVRRLSLGTVPIRNAFAAIQAQLGAIRETHRIPAVAPVQIDAAILAARGQQ